MRSAPCPPPSATRRNELRSRRAEPVVHATANMSLYEYRRLSMSRSDRGRARRAPISNGVLDGPGDIALRTLNGRRQIVAERQPGGDRPRRTCSRCRAPVRQPARRGELGEDAPSYRMSMASAPDRCPPLTTTAARPGRKCALAATRAVPASRTAIPDEHRRLSDVRRHDRRQRKQARLQY